MGLKSDITEVAQVWRFAGWRVKLFLALSVFLASGSIASLSETVFKWKGFVLDAIQFYRAMITEPAMKFATLALGLKLPDGFADYVVVATISTGAVLRAVFHRRKNWSERIFFGFVVVGGNLLSLALMTRGSTPMNPLYAWCSYAFMLSFMITAGQGAARILAVVYMLAPLVVVSLFAAINAGLVR